MLMLCCVAASAFAAIFIGAVAQDGLKPVLASIKKDLS
jgi:hypothetical protein